MPFTLRRHSGMLLAGILESTQENLDSGLPRRSLSEGGLKPLPE